MMVPTGGMVIAARMRQGKRDKLCVRRTAFLDRAEETGAGFFGVSSDSNKAVMQRAWIISTGYIEFRYIAHLHDHLPHISPS